MEQEFGVNQSLVEELYQRFQRNPRSVDPVWREYFQKGGAIDGLNGTKSGPSARHRDSTRGLPVATGSFPPTADVMVATELQSRVTAMVDSYRSRGHRQAKLDPLGLLPTPEDELSLERFGLQLVDPETVFSVGSLTGQTSLPLREIVRLLEETYCRSIGVEFKHIDEPEIRHWLQDRMESTCNHTNLNHEDQIHILSKLTDAEMFERFLHTNFIGAKRFSLEGAESAIPFLELLIRSTTQYEVDEIIIGMAHRGRLNVLANIMEKSLMEIFAAFEDHHPELHFGQGDVKYHLGYSSDRILPNGRSVHLSLSFNPSHLEWVNPVVEGRARAKQDRRGDADRLKVIPLLIHGDAAFAGQGVVTETLNLSQLYGYHTGGTIHFVINNQIGFTTSPEDGRSTPYATDITRMLRCPIFHVNGEDPEAVAQVARLAIDFRQQFQRDVVIDMYCYRQHGHNEGDEPRFTQPVMYEAIDRHESVREAYVKHLVTTGNLTEEEANEIAQTRHKALEQALEETRNNGFVPPVYAGGGVWKGYSGGADVAVEDVSTRVDSTRLNQLFNALNRLPEGFSPNPKIKRLMEQRRAQAVGEKPLDWGAAETLAYATLLAEGTRIRFSGQDSRRGTFSHRHAVLFDVRTGQPYFPLMNLHSKQGVFEIHDSPLSESGVLGFEYGYSLDFPEALVMWEAQFGDFVNAAQVIIDQFISSSEDKWKRLSGLVMLLPHGFEGQGPEHSSARLERFLALSAEDNMQVCNLTTPAQLFHCLRRQVVRPYRKPLVIMTPKSLLRHPAAVSSLDELAQGDFQRILKDTLVDPKQTRRILLCSGKIYYDLEEERRKRAIQDVAIIRFEQLYPLRAKQVRDTLSVYKKGTDLVWIQEEPRNMGAWYFINAALPDMLQGHHPLRCISRPASASPATGSLASHKLEQQWLVDAGLSSDEKDVHKDFIAKAS